MLDRIFKMNDAAMKIFLSINLKLKRNDDIQKMRDTYAKYENILSTVMEDGNSELNFFPNGGGVKHVHIHQNSLATKEELLPTVPGPTQRLFHYAIS